MSLCELLNDMTARFKNVETNHYPQINGLKAQLNAINNNYEIMKSKHSIVIQNIILIVLPLVFMYFFSYIPQEKKIWLGDLMKKNFLVLCGMWAIGVSPVAAPILNFIRSKIKYKRQIKRADEWWESTGKKQVVEINASINALKNDAYEYLCANPLYERLRSTDFCNSKDCNMLYLI